MSLTSLSLLERLRQQPSNADWQRLHDLYHPLIRWWLSRVPGIGQDIDDLTQEVLLVVHRSIAKFERQREGAFRAWLRAVTVNQIRNYRRQARHRPLVGFGGDETEDFLSRLDDPGSDLAREWDRDHDRHLSQRLLELVRPDFSEQTWAAFRQFAIDGHAPAKVAESLSISVNAVILAKSRVLKRLREEAGDLMS